MISIREMTAADEGAVMEMVDRFYHSPAVEHEVDPAVLRRSFQAAVDRAADPGPGAGGRRPPGGLPLYVHRLFR